MKSTARCNDGYVLYISIILILTISIYASVVLKAEQFRFSEVNRRLHKLQATILSYSGLNCAQAYVSGYGNRSVAWETELSRIACKSGGTILLSAFHEAGWLRVLSKGCFSGDTAIYGGLLGQVPPDIASNAISIVKSSGGVEIADLATVEGNIAIAGGKVMTTNNGKFNGKIVPFKPVYFTDEITEKSISIFNHFPDSSKSNDSIIVSFQQDLEKILLNSTEKPILIEGKAELKNVIILKNNPVLYVNGKIFIGQLSRITGMKCFVKGNLVITDNADLEQCVIVSSGNVKIEKNARFNGTIICAETLFVGGSSRVIYPSFLYLCSSGCKFDCRQVININDDAIVQGTIVTGAFRDNLPVPRIITGIHSKIEGILICPDALMPYGKFRGSIYTGRIIYKTEHNVYVNRLKEVFITQNDMSRMTIPIILKNGIPRYLSIKKLSGESL